MTEGHPQHVANAPIQPTPKSKYGAKFHGIKLDYYADPTQGDMMMLSWPRCAPGDVAFCGDRETFLATMDWIYDRLSRVAHERASGSDGTP